MQRITETLCQLIAWCVLLQVRNRTQEETNANLSATESAERERHFFEGEGPSAVSTHVQEALKLLSAKQKGKKALIDLLLKVQGDRLTGSLAPLKKKVGHSCPDWVQQSSVVSCAAASSMFMIFHSQDTVSRFCERTAFSRSITLMFDSAYNWCVFVVLFALKCRT